MPTTAYLEAKKITLDSIKCKEGKPCGKICIPKKNKCAVNSTLKSPNPSKNLGPIIAGVGIGGALGTATIAAGLGVFTVEKLRQIKERYQSNFASSAIRAEAESKNIKAPYLPPGTKTAILTVGGFGTKDAYSESEVLKKNIESLGVKGLYIEPQSYAEFNVPTKPHDLATKKLAATEGKDLFIKTVVDIGYNPVAIKVAAKVIAYKKANPDKEYQLIGHSGGGLVVQEAHEILHKAGIDTKTTAIGSPDVGLIPGTKDLVTTTSKHDGILKLSGGRGVNGKAFNNVTDHAQNSYFQDKDFRDFIKNRVTPTRADRFDKAICKVGKNCGDICIPVKSICRSENKDVTNTPKSKNPINGLAVKAGLVAGAGILGISAAAYATQKVRFQLGFANSAKLAKEQAKTYTVPQSVFTGFRSVDSQQLPNSTIKSGVESIDTGDSAKQITFFAGGVGAVGGLEGDHIGQQVSKMFPDHHVVAIETPEQDVTFGKGDTVASAKFLKKVASAILKDNITKGRSEVAVRIAARAYAYHQKNPTLPINLVGQSGGGMPVRESVEILKRMGVKDTKVVTVGSPYFGLTAPSGISIVDPKKDPANKIYGATMPNKVYVNAVGHSLYFAENHYKVFEHGTWEQQVSKNIHQEAVVNKDVQKVLVDYFDRDSKANKKGLVPSYRMTQDSEIANSNTLRQLQRQFSILLSRSYGKPIVKIGGIKVSIDNTVTGMAQDSLGKILNFTFKDDKITYQLGKKTAKMDSSDLYIGLVASYRKDKSSIKKKCRTGISCGGTCIEANDTCRLKLNQIASPSEVSRLKQTIVQFKLQQNAIIAPPPPPENTPEGEGMPVKSKYIVDPKTGIPYSIRELRKQASEKKIYGYGSMTIKELQGTLQLYDQKPESRDRITKGITKQKGSGTKAIAISGLSGRGSPLERTTKRNLKNTYDTWRKLEALAKFAGSSSARWGAAAVGAFLIGQTVKNYERAKQSYREGFNESARIAEERASKLNIQHPVERDGVPTMLANGKPRMSSRINQDNITFALGSGKGYGAEEMKAALQKEKDPSNTKEYWFTHSNYIVPFNLKEFGTPRPPGGGDPGIASTVVNGVGGIVKNFTRKRNQDAVDLAAQIYAHAIAVSPADGKTLVNKNKKINIVAHCNGGLVTKEALEIVSKMELKGSPTGKKVLERVNAVYLGTPHFGFAENVSRRQRTIVSPRDPISTLPVFGDGARQQWISSVSGGSAKDYLKDERVRDSIREAFGYYQGSPEEAKRRVEKRGDSGVKEEGRGKEEEVTKISHLLPSPYSLEKELTRLDFFKNCKTGIPCGEICLPPGRKCRLRESKLDPRKISAKLGRGTVAQTIGGVGQDLERAYLRTSRLIKTTQRKSNKKQLPLTRQELVKEKLIHEARLVGVLLGQGTISKTLKSVDEKLIDFSDFVSAAPEKISDAIASVQEQVSNLIKKVKK